jgi:phosphoesterase RecJ-like protein
MSPELGPAVEVIGAASRLTLACHVGPDGDALGSMLGMAGSARRRGVPVETTFGEPFTLPETYRFLPLDLLIPPGEVGAEPEVFVTFDAGSLDRLGSVGPVAQRARTLVVIDHHASNAGFGHVNVILPEASSTAEIVYRLLVALDWPIDPVVATCLHTGIVTDTGRFQYSNTTPATLEAAARLVELGARPEVIGQHVYEEAPYGYLSVAAAVLGRAQIDRERRLVWSVLMESDLDAAGVGLDDTDPLIDAIRVPRETDVAMLVKAVEHDRVKVSLRSRGRVDVGAIASDLTGGGHHNAAGFTFRGSVEEAVAAVVSRLDVVGPL